METVVIVVSACVVVGAYLYVCIKDRSYLNLLTPSFALVIPTSYLLDIFRISLVGPSGSITAYLLTYGAFALQYLALAIGYSLAVPSIRLPFSVERGANVRASGRLGAYALFVIAVLLYAPVLIEFRSQLLNPRAVYEQTRSGYGLSYFLSISLCYLALIQMLFVRGVGRLEAIMFFLLAMVFLWLHGSKGNMLTVLFIVGIYGVYVRGWVVGLWKFVGFGAGLAVIGALLFLITTPDILLRGGLAAVADYSDYTRNDMLVVDSDFPIQYGRLSAEMQFYARVPRAVYPSKPDDFGMFYLAERFYPSEFARGEGAPAFGNGVLFADFGGLGALAAALSGFVMGVLMRSFHETIKTRPGPGEFVLLLFGAGISLVTIGGVFLLPEALLLAVGVNALARLKLFGAGSSLSAV